MKNAKMQTWLERLKASIPDYDTVHLKQVGMFAWLRDLLNSIAENDTAKLEETLAVKPYQLYVDINTLDLAKVAEVTALFKNVDVTKLTRIWILYIGVCAETKNGSLQKCRCI